MGVDGPGTIGRITAVPADTAELEEIRREVHALGPWFHDLDLRGVRTAPEHPLGGFLEDLWRAVAPAFPEDMAGASVLDIGCNAGFYSLQLAGRGARVTGIDHNPRYLLQARFAADVLGLQLELTQMDAYDVGELGRSFDYVLFMGVLYHLRYPLLALDRVRGVVGRRLVFQTLVRGATGPMTVAEDYPFEEEAVFDDPRFPRLHFIEHSYAGDPTNWWVPNDAAAAALLRAAAFHIDDHPGPGVYFCAPALRSRPGERPGERPDHAGGGVP